ncbi:DUF5916 domain-containing protein [Glaciecola petra]|uniref:DUF5916 domain-containing protein n=1 Tax=Glaciecola petra TaxID=3075602 RepID=A0ABU2ZU11_9ALTE|nr:DUF5916 domain-containing protein [Aestuariibacter sp. P117]MDT0596133.1 DUF5916 domain-containing protein [Aestuariibacter sp. P117]
MTPSSYGSRLSGTKTIYVLFTILCLLLSTSVASQSTGNDQAKGLDVASINIPNLQNQIEIDGNYSQDEWQGSQLVELAYISRPFENLPPPAKTNVRVFENGSELYVLFEAFDPEPEQIRAFLRDRDSSFGNDLVGIKLDPYNDGRLAYQFYANPLGVQNDSIENEMTGSESASWNGIWESAGQLTETGFVVEMKIPLRLMNFVESDDIKTWAIEFVRFYPRSDRYRLSHVPFDRNNSCGLCQMGEANGFKDAKQANDFVFVPTLVVGSGRTRDPVETNDWEYQNNQEFGLDVNWSLTPEVNLSGTLNPDFSQVEADVAQLNINNTFALFFEERRPFFVENAEYFSSNLNLIYTRNINQPDYGTKITGRVDEHSFGLVVANDNTTQFLVPGNLGSEVAFIEEKSINIASRYRYDYSDDFSIGGLTTFRKSDSYQNAVASIDLRYRLSEQDTIRAQYVRSQTEYPEFLQAEFCDNNCSEDEDLSEAALRTALTDRFSGYSYRIDYNRETENYYLNARRSATQSDFRADLGFVSNVDRARYVFGGGYNWRNENSWWNEIRVNGDWDITHNDNGELIEKELEGYFSVRGDYQTFARVGFTERNRVGLRFDNSILSIDGNTSRFDELSNSFYFTTTPNQIISYEFFARIGDRVDLANNRLGDQVFLEHEVTLNLGTHARIEIEKTRSRLDVDEQALFVADLYDVRATYQFDPLQFVRLILTYSDVDRNQQNYTFDVDANSKNLGVQLLYSYKLNPLTKFFVGYSHSAFDDDSLDKIRPDNQSIFLKLSYAWFPDF